MNVLLAISRIGVVLYTVGAALWCLIIYWVLLYLWEVKYQAHWQQWWRHNRPRRWSDDDL